MKRTVTLSLLLVLLIPSLIVSQTPRSKGNAANQSWPSFIVVFRAAVAKRNRAVLRGMIATPFITQVDGELHSPDEVINWLGQSKLWGELLKEVRLGARFTDPGGQGLQKCASNGIFCFKLEPDGRWRLSEQAEND